MQRKKLAMWFCSVIVFALILSNLYVEPIRADEAQNSPSNNDEPDWWDSPENAYTSNNAYAAMARVDDGFHEVQYFDYNFPDLTGYTINEVWVYAEHYTGHVDDVCEVRLSWDGGSSWTAFYDMPVTQFEILWDVDFTSVRSWSPSDFTNANFIVELQADIEATGCYHPDSEVSVWETKASLLNFDMTVKKISEVKKGDVLLSRNLTSGEYIPNVMLEDAILHKEKFTFYRIIAEHKMELWDKEIYPWEDPNEIGYKDICATEEQRIYTLEKGAIPANEVKVGMHFHGLFRKDGKLLSEPIPITSIETFEDFGAITLNGTSEIVFSHYLMGKTGKTYYLDWLPVKVIYTVPSGFEYWDCQFIGTNTTVAGATTLFTSNWTDVYDAEGLSFWLYSTNRTSTWQNTSWSNSWRSTVCADYVDTLGSTAYVEYFQFFVNDTSDVEYASAIMHFPVYVVPDDLGAVYYMLGGVSWLPISLLFAFLGRRKKDAD